VYIWAQLFISVSACMTCHAFDQNLARERSLFLARPHGTALCWHPRRNLANFKKKLKTFYFSLAFDCIWHRFYVTIVMHLRSYSSGGTNKFLTWTWTWTWFYHYRCAVVVRWARYWARCWTVNRRSLSVTTGACRSTLCARLPRYRSASHLTSSTLGWFRSSSPNYTPRSVTEKTFSKLLREILGTFLMLGKS